MRSASAMEHSTRNAKNYICGGKCLLDVSND